MERLTFCQPAGAMIWEVGRQRVNKLLLPIDSIIEAVNVCPSALGARATRAATTAVNMSVQIDRVDYRWLIREDRKSLEKKERR